MVKIAPSHLTASQSFIIGGGFKDPQRVVNVTSQTSLDILHLRTTHQEADTMILLHTIEYCRNGYSRVTVHCNDTDVLVLLLYYFQSSHIQETVEIFMHSGLGGKERFISIHSIATKIGKEICCLLPAVHVLTSCDSTSSIRSIGKKKQSVCKIDEA